MSKPAKKPSPASSQIEVWALEDLKPYERNAREHPPEQVEKLARSITEFGFTIPLLVSEDGEIIAGHGRELAARSLGLAEVPVIVARGWSEERRRAYRIADNALALGSEWNDEFLRIELADLAADDFDVALTGLGEDDLSRLLAEATTEGLTDPDAEVEPDADAPAVSMAGDIWVLGGHRIICGDSTDAETVARLLGGEKPHLMVTDPPYGVSYDPNWRNQADRANGKPYGARAVGLVTNDDRADWRAAWALFPGDVAYCWHADRHASSVQGSLEAASFEIRCQIIWAKNVFAIGRGDYHWQHEPCWYAVRKGATGHWNGDRKQTTLWEIDKPRKSETGHSTQKPVECMKRPIENNSKPGDAVYEPFSGSGTTIVAGEMTGRRVFAVELNPPYVDVAVRRWPSFTGKVATLSGDGRTFDEIARERGVDVAA